MINLFINNLKNILISEYRKELKENEAMTKINKKKAKIV